MKLTHLDRLGYTIRFYGISILDGYLMLNPVYTYIMIIILFVWVL